MGGCIYLWGYFIGTLVGVGIMIILSILSSWAEIKAYDWAKKDFWGGESLDDFLKIAQQYESEAKFFLKKKFFSFIVWGLSHGRWPMLTAISLWQEPAIAVILSRSVTNGHFEYHMSRKDWVNFWVSVPISNIPWAMVVLGGIGLFDKLKTLIFG